MTCYAPTPLGPEFPRGLFGEVEHFAWNIVPPFSAVEQITWKLFHLPENFSPKQLLSGAVEDGQEEAVRFFEAWKAQVETKISFPDD